MIFEGNREGREEGRKDGWMDGWMGSFLVDAGSLHGLRERERERERKERNVPSKLSKPSKPP